MNTTIKRRYYFEGFDHVEATTFQTETKTTMLIVYIVIVVVVWNAKFSWWESQMSLSRRAEVDVVTFPRLQKSKHTGRRIDTNKGNGKWRVGVGRFEIRVGVRERNRLCWKNVFVWFSSFGNNEGKENRSSISNGGVVVIQTGDREN